MDVECRLQVAQTSRAPLPIGPYSQAVSHGDLVFCSGQIPVDVGSGMIAADDASMQAEVVLKHLGEVLRAAGSDYNAVLKTTVFLCDMADFAAVNEVYARYFGEARPARSTVAVAALPKGARVEIEAVAIRTA
jgi:2-iminobutanoate/2-iminopropanoate deaminase